MEKILAKLTAPDRFFEVFVGGRDDSDIETRFAVSTHGTNRLGLQELKKPRLQTGRQLADLVQEHGAALRKLESPDPSIIGARERASLVPEKLGFQCAFMQAREIDRDE
jgi:hypothetical protein